MTLLDHCGGYLAHSSLQNCFISQLLQGLNLFKVVPKHFNWIQVKTLTRPELQALLVHSSLVVVLGSFLTSWMSRQSVLGVILVGQPPLGRFATDPVFLYL